MLRIKEQEARLTLQEHDDDDDRGPQQYTWRLLIYLIPVFLKFQLQIRISSYVVLTFTVNEMGPHWMLTLLYLKMLSIGLKMTVYGRNM